MAGTVETSIAIQKALFDEAETLAQRLNISQGELFEIAIEQFIRDYQNIVDENNQGLQDQHETTKEPVISQEAQAARGGAGQTVINQGDIFWVQIDDGSGSEGGIPHPHVVIQDNVFNHSRIQTVVACALTSNIKWASLPGNVLLEPGEANLSRQSVVEASKVSTVDKAQLGAYIGSLNERRVNQILAGMRFLQMSFFER
jgi:mRNA interferase MazF